MQTLKFFIGLFLIIAAFSSSAQSDIYVNTDTSNKKRIQTKEVACLKILGTSNINVYQEKRSAEDTISRHVLEVSKKNSSSNLSSIRRYGYTVEACNDVEIEYWKKGEAVVLLQVFVNNEQKFVQQIETGDIDITTELFPNKGKGKHPNIPKKYKKIILTNVKGKVISIKVTSLNILVPDEGVFFPASASMHFEMKGVTSSINLGKSIILFSVPRTTSYSDNTYEYDFEITPCSNRVLVKLTSLQSLGNSESADVAEIRLSKVGSSGIRIPVSVNKPYTEVYLSHNYLKGGLIRIQIKKNNIWYSNEDLPPFRFKIEAYSVEPITLTQQSLPN